jgi:hypothetical protein
MITATLLRKARQHALIRTRRAGMYYPRKVDLNANNPAEIVARLTELRVEHRDLDEAISRLSADLTVDQLALTRMKKRKLKLKDWIGYLESKLIPDLDA